MTSAIMECGHAANASYGDGVPCCAICVGIHPGWDVVAHEDFMVVGRVARCSCGKTEPSSKKLAFFEYRGEGSRQARESCANCGYSQIAHIQEDTRTQKNVVQRGECPGFEMRGAWEYDSFYCGCRGWD